MYAAQVIQGKDEIFGDEDEGDEDVDLFGQGGGGEGGGATRRTSLSANNQVWSQTRFSFTNFFIMNGSKVSVLRHEV